MRRFYFLPAISLLFILLVCQSCNTVKHMAVFQEQTDSANGNKVVYPNFENKNQIINSSFEAVIQSNDILAIYVSSLSPEGSSFFNPVFEGTQGTTGAGSNTPVSLGYLVDVDGNIEIPLVGAVKVAGLTTTQARELIKSKLEKYLLNPTLRIYFQNFRVTVLGEVNRPGVINVPNEKMTLVELIGLAGDLTAFANRAEILIIRDENGKKSFNLINLKTRDIFDSQFLYMHPNDIVYVRPVKAKAAQTDLFYRVAPLIISAITLISLLAVRFTGN